MIFNVGYQKQSGTRSSMNKIGMIMKLMVPLLLFCIFQVNANTYAQKVSIVKNQLSLPEAFSRIEKQTGYTFFYDKDLIKESVQVDLSLRNASIDQALHECLKDQPLTYTIVANTIVIQPKPFILLPGNDPITDLPEPPPIDIRGKVVDQGGNPLEGASVIIKGTSIGTTVDHSGNFSLNVPSNNSILVISFIGMKSKEVRVGTQTNFTIVLEQDAAQASDAVVITALGIARSQRALGYSVGEVKGEEMTKVPQENVLNALTGKVTGLKISNTTMDINSDPQVLIRGIKSLSGDDAPLVVINGLPVGNNLGVLSDLSAENIESVSVLKGPSAAALYGSRAGSGVLIVTTKSGKSAQKGIGVSFNSSYTASVPYHYLPQQDQFANGSRGTFNPAQVGWWGAPMGTPAVQWNSDGQAVPLKAYPDNVKNFVQTGNSFINEINVHSSGEKLSFNLSMLDTRANGTYPGVELKKNAFALSATYDINKKLKVSTNFNYANSRSDNFRSQVWDNYPFEDLYFMPNYIDINSVKNYWEVEGIQQNVWDDHFNNPWFTAYVNIDKFRKVNAYGNIKLDYAITSELSLMGRIGTFYQSYVTTSQHGWTEVRNRLGSYNFNSSIGQETNADFLLSYKKRFGDFSMNLSGGGNLLFQNGTSSAIGGQNLILPGLYTSGNVDRNSVGYSSAFSKKRINSLYGMASFDYRKVVYLDLTSRNDWSSTLPPNNRSYYYPSASLSLIVSDMITMPDFVSLVKLRGGWAQVGKDTKPYQLTQTLIKSNWGSYTTYSLQTGMANNNLKPESIVSTEAGFDLSFFSNRLGLNFTYYEVEDRDQIMNVSTPPETGYMAASVNAGVVKNQGVEVSLNGTPVKSRDLTWNMNFVFTKDRSKLMTLPEGITVFQFWARTNAYNQTKVGEYIGDVWGNDVVRVQEGEYKGWPIVNANGYTSRDPNLKKIGNVISDFSLGYQTSLTYKRFTVSANLDWRQGGKYYSESMLRMTRDGRQESWYKGDGSSTFTGILSNNSFSGNKDQLAQEIKSHPEIYNAADGLTYVGGRTAELGGFPLTSTGLSNGAFFPGVRADGSGGYIENFGGPDTKYFPIDDIVEFGYWDQGVQTWMYDASFIKLRELAVAYNFPAKWTNPIKAQALSLSVFMRNLIIWTAAKNNIDPESAGYMRTGIGAPYNLGWDRANMAPWTAVMGLKLNVQF